MTSPRTRRLPAASLLLLACATSAQAAEADAEDNVTAKVGGRLHWDIANFDNDTRGTPNPDDSDLRALWLDLSGKFYGVN
ncbi:MAG TPA: porin, partial [Pseudoxanthomonas sp.]|nr:porin [Pseudoxanthomonas sp.]